jgi:hypothetical protein
MENETKKFQLFKSNDFLEPICCGEMRTVLDRITNTANEVLSEKKALVSIHDEDISQVWELRHISAKLKGLSYLIQRLDPDADSPADASETYWGIGLMIEDLGERVKDVSRILESFEIEAAQQETIQPPPSVNSTPASTQTAENMAKTSKTARRSSKRSQAGPKHSKKRSRRNKS